MASVMFSAIGQAVGGPLAAAVGAAVGGGLDSVLFGARRRGASELLVQRSAYGDVLPRLYGRTRAAGQLIWALPMAGAAGKGSGRRTAGSSFAIALSSAPVIQVGRIWADGREIRNAAGEFEAPTQMRLHQGGWDQIADPLVVAAEGEDRTLAYRGLAYVLFENFDLSPFGNRIPNFSFEVIADEDDPIDWLRDQARSAGMPVQGVASAQSVTGYAALGRGLDECARLCRFGDISLGFADGEARFSAAPRVFAIKPQELLAADGDAAEIVQGSRPASMGVTYMDSERDYQPGRQRVARARRGPELESEAPVAATAGMALSLAGKFLRQSEAAADRMRLGLSWRWLAVSVGDILEIEGLGRWRIVTREIRALQVFCEGERAADQETWPVVTSDGGRNLPSPVVPAGPTDMLLFEVPVPLAGGRPTAWLWMGGGPGWRGAAASLLAGSDVVAIGEIRQPMSWGRLLAPLAPGPETLWDMHNILLVKMQEGSPAFESRNAEDVLAGANLVRVGDELLQFCDAEPLEGNVVRLSSLLRGRFGTGFAMQPLLAGETVRLIVPSQLLAVDLPPDSIGRSLVMLATGRGDPVGGTEAGLDVEGLASSPLGPVHVRVQRNDEGSLSSSWLPRHAEAWNWSAGEPAHSNWMWQFQASDGRSASRFVDGLALDLSVAEQIGLLGVPFGAGVVTISAIGDGPVDLRTSAPVEI